MTRYSRGMDPDLIPICPVCETRRVTVLPHGGYSSACRPCRNAQRYLQAYWAKIGMPLSWRPSRRSRWLTVLRMPSEGTAA